MITLLTVFFINASSTPGATGPTGPTGQVGPAQELTLEEGRTISVSKIEFSGNQEVPANQLETLTTPFLNRSLSEADLAELKERIQLLYRSKGFMGTKVVIASKPEGDVLKVEIEEGRKSTEAPGSTRSP